jgi:hypothetical protein
MMLRGDSATDGKRITITIETEKIDGTPGRFEPGGLALNLSRARLRF